MEATSFPGSSPTRPQWRERERRLSLSRHWGRVGEDPENEVGVNYTGQSPQLDAIQNKEGIADCNVHNKNNNSFLPWKRKSHYVIPILAIVCVHFTSNAEIFKTINIYFKS